MFSCAELARRWVNTNILAAYASIPHSLLISLSENKKKRKKKVSNKKKTKTEKKNVDAVASVGDAAFMQTSGGWDDSALRHTENNR